MNRMVLAITVAVAFGCQFLQQTRADEDAAKPQHNVTVQLLMFHGAVDTICDLFPDPFGPGRSFEVSEPTLKQIREFERAKKITVIACPQIATVSGSQAQVRLVLEKIYPTEYSQVEVSSGSGSTGIIAAAPTSFRTREIGTLLNVTPVVTGDGKSIHVTVIPEVSQFNGMKATSAKINSPSVQPNDIKDGDFVIVSPAKAQTMSVEIEQPDFTSINCQTSITLTSGRPVVLIASLPQADQKAIPLDHILVIIMAATSSLPGGGR